MIYNYVLSLKKLGHWILFYCMLIYTIFNIYNTICFHTEYLNTKHINENIYQLLSCWFCLFSFCYFCSVSIFCFVSFGFVWGFFFVLYRYPSLCTHAIRYTQSKEGWKCNNIRCTFDRFSKNVIDFWMLMKFLIYQYAVRQFSSIIV